MQENVVAKHIEAKPSLRVNIAVVNLRASKRHDPTEYDRPALLKISITVGDESMHQICVETTTAAAWENLSRACAEQHDAEAVQTCGGVRWRIQVRGGIVYSDVTAAETPVVVTSRTVWPTCAKNCAGVFAHAALLVRDWIKNATTRKLMTVPPPTRITTNARGPGAGQSLSAPVTPVKK